MCSIRVARAADGVKNACSGARTTLRSIAWRDLPRSTRFLFWTGLVAAAVSIAIFAFLLWAASQIDG
jgi:hypothetical protein